VASSGQRRKEPGPLRPRLALPAKRPAQRTSDDQRNRSGGGRSSQLLAQLRPLQVTADSLITARHLAMVGLPRAVTGMLGRCLTVPTQVRPTGRSCWIPSAKLSSAIRISEAVRASGLISGTASPTADPLEVIDLSDAWFGVEEWQNESAGLHPEIAGPLELAISADYLHKANISGGAPYCIWLPCTGLSSRSPIRAPAQRNSGFCRRPG
jgi:hypothetical protein